MEEKSRTAKYSNESFIVTKLLTVEVDFYDHSLMCLSWLETKRF